MPTYPFHQGARSAITLCQTRWSNSPLSEARKVRKPSSAGFQRRETSQTEHRYDSPVAMSVALGQHAVVWGNVRLRDASAIEESPSAESSPDSGLKRCAAIIRAQSPVSGLPEARGTVL